MRSHKTSFLLFCGGCFVFYAAPIGANSRLEQFLQAQSADKSASEGRNTKRHLDFYPTTMGEMRDEDGVHLGFTSLNASDGSKLMVLYEDFESSAKAKDYFEKKLARAAKIIERKNKLNTEGKVVGERAEILLRLASEKTAPAVLWTDGVKFHEIYSSSRESILKLEKVYKY